MMKARTTAVLIALAILLAMAATLPGSALAESPIRVYVNGESVLFPDVQPRIDGNGRVMVPGRFVSEALGCKVDWHEKTRTVTIARGLIEAELTIDEKVITVLGIKKEMNTAAVLEGDRTMVPLRFVSEAFGCSVDWKGDDRTVTITDPGEDIYKVGDFSLPIEEGDRLQRSTDGGLVLRKKSGLALEEGIGESFRAVLGIDIRVDNPATDIPKQRQEAETLLKQCLSDELTVDIMTYVAKKDRFDVLEDKTWEEGRYKIDAVGGFGGPIVIVIWMY